MYGFTWLNPPHGRWDLNHWLSPVLYVCYGRLLRFLLDALNERRPALSLGLCILLLLHGQHVWQDVGQHLQQGWALLPRALLPLLGLPVWVHLLQNHITRVLQDADCTDNRKKIMLHRSQRLGLKTEKLTYFWQFSFSTECFCISASQLTLFSLHLKHADSLPRQKLHSIDPTGAQSGLLVSKHVHAD